MDPYEKLYRVNPIVRGRHGSVLMSHHQHSPSPSLLKASSMIMQGDASPYNDKRFSTPIKPQDNPMLYNGILVPSFDKRVQVMPYQKPIV